MLEEARELHVLKLRFPKYESSGSYGLTYIAEVLGSAQISHLYELAIRQCFTTSHYLKDFIFSHKATLRRLALWDIYLVDPSDSWQQVFKDIAGQLPQLCKIKLRGHFRFESSLPFDFGMPGGSLPEAMPLRDDMENFVLKGGEVPDWEKTHSHEEISPPEERPDYKQSGLPMDNTAPDDPILDYESDEFYYVM